MPAHVAPIAGSLTLVPCVLVLLARPPGQLVDSLALVPHVLVLVALSHGHVATSLASVVRELVLLCRPLARYSVP